MPEPATAPVYLSIRQIRKRHTSLCLKINKRKVWSAVADDLNDAVRTGLDWLSTIGAPSSIIQDAQARLATKRSFRASFPVEERSFTYAPVG